MAVGQQLKAASQVPYPKRLVSSTGSIPSLWSSGKLRRTATVKLYSQRNVSFSLRTNCLPKGHCTHKLMAAATACTRSGLPKIPAWTEEGPMLQQTFLHPCTAAVRGPCSSRRSYTRAHTGSIQWTLWERSGRAELGEGGESSDQNTCMHYVNLNKETIKRN